MKRWQNIVAIISNSLLLLVPMPEYPNPKFHIRIQKMKVLYVNMSKICGENLINAIQRLAQNDTIEELGIFCPGPFWVISGDGVNCIFRERNHSKLYIRPFSNLKTVCVRNASSFRQRNHVEACENIDLFTVYSTHILPNVENLFIKNEYFHSMNLDFIKYASIGL